MIYNTFINTIQIASNQIKSNLNDIFYKRIMLYKIKLLNNLK